MAVILFLIYLLGILVLVRTKITRLQRLFFQGSKHIDWMILVPIVLLSDHCVAVYAPIQRNLIVAEIGVRAEESGISHT